MKSKIKALIALLYGSLALAPTAGAADSCHQLFTPSAYSVLNQTLTAKYPELAVITKDPVAFVNSIQARFKAQKKINPQLPLDFDYSEVGIPTVRYALDSLLAKTKVLEERLLNKKNDYLKIPDLLVFKRLKVNSEVEELHTALRLFRALTKEAEGYLKAGSINYRQILEYQYYFSRAIGHFDERELSPLTRVYLAIDRAFQGYKQLDIDSEVHKYRERKFEIFQTKSTLKGFQLSEGPYLEALQHPDSPKTGEELNAIIVPVFQDIGRDILMRVASTEISIVGITAVPIAADGFVRPSGDFEMHDVRHESARMFEIANYIEKNGITRAQWREFNRLQEKWYLELEQERSKVQDEDLRGAIDLVSFNYFHDRGYPIAPSIWKSRNRTYIFYSLLLILRLSGQGAGYNKVLASSAKATDWLNQFWEQRYPEELAFLESVRK